MLVTTHFLFSPLPPKKSCRNVSRPCRYTHEKVFLPLIGPHKEVFLCNFPSSSSTMSYLSLDTAQPPSTFTLFPSTFLHFLHTSATTLSALLVPSNRNLLLSVKKEKKDFFPQNLRKKLLLLTSLTRRRVGYGILLQYKGWS